MNARRTLEWALGSVLVYGIVAACGGGGSGSGSGPGSGGGAGSGGSLFDVLTDPVADALGDVNQSGSRLKAKYWAAADGAKQFLQKWHDTQLKVDCSFKLAADSKVRCLPDAPEKLYYGDDKCSQPLMNDPAAGSCPSKYVSDTTTIVGTCATTAQGVRLYEKGAAYTGTGGVYTKQSNVCNYLSPVGNQNPLFVATEVPLTTFVEATEAVEP